MGLKSVIININVYNNIKEPVPFNCSHLACISKDSSAFFVSLGGVLWE